MTPLPELARWRTGTDTERAEARIRWLKARMADAERAIDAQRRLIEEDGQRVAYTLSMNSLEAAIREHESELATLMAEREIEVIDFALDGPKYARHRAGSKTLSVFLDAMQRLFERVGQSLAMPNPGAKIPSTIRQMCELEVAGFYPSSFGIRFTVPTRVDMAGDSLANSALEATFDLVNTEDPIEQVARLGERAKVQYRHLITTLITAEATPKVSWRTPSGENREWVSSANTLLTLSNRLANIREMQPKAHQVTGVLTGASLRRQKFEFAGDDGVITGKAPKELADKVTQSFGKPCRITYVETLYIDEYTDKEKKTRTLTDIEPI